MKKTLIFNDLENLPKANSIVDVGCMFIVVKNAGGVWEVHVKTYR